MVAASVRITAASEVLGEIESQGKLLAPDGEEVATFRQTFQVWRGSRVLTVAIELDPRVEPRADAWNSYYACRFAWGDESAILTRGLQETRHRVEAGSFEAPQYIEIDDGKIRVAVLTGGLPFHRLVDYRMLDSLLITRGESQRRFRLGIAVDSPQPLVDSLEMLCPAPLIVPTEVTPPTATGWLFHLGVKSIVPTHWEPLWDDGRAVGFRVRLLETTGRPVRTPLAALRPLRSARTLDFLGRPLGDCSVEDGRAVITMSANEWLQLEARWA
jgi:alpha-mannosidase